MNLAFSTASGVGGLGRFKVAGCFVESFNFIVEFSKGGVTGAAEKSANFSSYMAVINSKAVTCFALIGTTNGTLTVLLFQHHVVLCQGQTEFVF